MADAGNRTLPDHWDREAGSFSASGLQPESTPPRLGFGDDRPPTFFRWISAHRRWLVLALLVALPFRLWVALHFAQVSPDSFGYEALAENLARHGVYSLDGPPDLRPTDARMPGYPLFLAAIHAFAGTHARTVARVVQAVADASLVFWLPWLAWELCPAAAVPTLLAAVLQPFTVEYTAAILSESLAIVLTSVALLLMILGYKRNRAPVWFGCGTAISGAILLRPDSVLLLASLLLLSVPIWTRFSGKALRSAVLFGAGLLLVWAPWMARNGVSMHRLQPLANFYAAQSGETTPVGFLKWTRTWVADDNFLESVSWRIGEERIDPDQLPPDAFDTTGERREVVELLGAYNENTEMSPAADTRFAEIADQRIARHPLRYFALLPLCRSLTLWFSPRYMIYPLTERLLSWRGLVDDPRESVWINLFFLMKALVVCLGAAGMLLLRDRWLAAWAATVVLGRIVVFSWLPYPEYRYVLEVFPIALALSCVGATLLLSARAAP